tara:strand:- start:5213 stop:5362 length:150 start_codon:yes stop_codon:yes gene_type:complete
MSVEELAKECSFMGITPAKSKTQTILLIFEKYGSGGTMKIATRWPYDKI